MSRVALFDVDGTLLDTSYLHTVCWWQAFRQQGTDVSMALLHRSIGMGSAELLDHVRPERDRDQDDAVIDAHLALYAQYWPGLRPLPAAADLLARCKKADLTVVLASSASDAELQALRAALDADQYIDEATGSADASAGKPSPDILRAALERVGAAASDAVFVGDSVWDGQAATTLGIAFIGLLCGGTSETELREAGAVEVYDDPSALLAAFASSVLS
jgi:HAD superfamily hydrolase (TIGR01509 family)